MALDCYLPGKMILIDAAGWSDLLLGVVVGALKPPNPMLMERRISVTSFQPPNFQNKKYLQDAAKIADEIVSVMQPDEDTCIKVSSEYVLSSVVERLDKFGFKVQVVESTGDLHGMVEAAFVRWCVEKGVPEELLKEKQRFWGFLDWVAEMPNLREGLVKTGWSSWEEKWRQELFKRPRP
ncbi:MAG: hypothetical protein NWE92_08940 [Candidatus Bathyarchaeota archaeon]|nr:hypothetical protein [Candidatus Bathyarchaeota archaeon]